jgi:hypothetical protein
VKELVRFDPRAVTALDAARFNDEGIVETLIVSAAADIDSPPDGVSEIVSLTKSPKAGTTDLLVVRAPGLLEGKPPTQLAINDFVVTGQDEVFVVDVDGDDLPDAVVLTRGKNRDKLRVYRNDANGSFLTTPIVLELLPGAAPDAPVAVARVITGVLPNGRPRAELAVVTQSRLLLARVSEDKARLDIRDLTELLGAPLSNRLTGVAAGDFDGDGVQDLAIADSGAIRLLRQQPGLR